MKSPFWIVTQFGLIGLDYSFFSQPEMYLRKLPTKKKNPIYKNQWQEPIHQKYKANESTSRHNPKKKNENQQSMKNRDKKLYANMTQGYEMLINDNKEKPRWKNCCLSQID